MIEGGIVDCVIYSPLSNPNHLNTCIMSYPKYKMHNSLRNLTSFEKPVSRTARFASTYFHNALFELNLLDDEIRKSKSPFQFKHRLLEIVRPLGNSNKICDISGVKPLKKLRVHFCAPNEQRFKHAFDCLSPVCFCG